MFGFWRKRSKQHKAPPSTRHNPLRARLGVEQMEDRSTPAVVFSGSYDWNDTTVNVTVDDSAPGYAGLYHWNYNVQNDSFASGIAAFAVPLELSGMASNVGSDVNWIGSPGGFMGDAALVSWQADSGIGAPPPGGGDPPPPPAQLLGIGQSANFWFTTTPTAIGITAGFIAAPGLAVTPGGTLVTAMADAPGLPQAPPPGLLVSTTTYDDIVNTDQWYTLREAVSYVNNLPANSPQKRIAFKSTLAGSTITMDPNAAQGYGQFSLRNHVFIDGPSERITIKRDTTSQIKHRLFDVADNVVIKLNDLNLRDGEVTTTEGSGAVRSHGYLTVEDCTFSQNKAVGSHGGAIAAFNKTLHVARSGFTGNSAMFGGGIYIGERVIANISSSALTLNTALLNGDTPVGAGGALYIVSSTTADRTIVTLTGVDVNGNTAFGQGGGIYVSNPPGEQAGTKLTLDGGTTVQNNQVTSTSGKGGGVSFGKGQLVLGGATIDNNTAATGPSIYRLNTGTALTLVPETTNVYVDDTGP